jgi:hypothetical protein
MTTLELTLMSKSPSANAFMADSLKHFEIRHRATLHVQLLSWATSWTHLVRVGIYGQGPDISEIGSTWVNDFQAMNALDTFSRAELGDLGTGPFALSAPAPTSVAVPASGRGSVSVGSYAENCVIWPVGAGLRPAPTKLHTNRQTAVGCAFPGGCAS